MKKGHTLGIILILIGVAWIVRQTGLLSVNWAAAMKTLWPIFLVAAGATIMLGQKKRLVTGIWILTFVLLIGFGVYKRDESTQLIDFNERFQLNISPLDLGPVAELQKKPIEKEVMLEQGTEEGRLILQLGAVKVNLTEGSNDLLVRLDSNIPMLEQRLSQGEQAVLEYSHEQNNRKAIPHFDLEMNPVLLWEIDASLGVVDGKMNLVKIPVRLIDLKLAAGDLDITLGSQQANTLMNLYAGAADLDIYIPKDAGLKVKSGNFMSDLDFYNVSMDKKGDYYISENYDTAGQKIEIDVATAMSAIKIFAQ